MTDLFERLPGERMKAGMGARMDARTKLVFVALAYHDGGQGAWPGVPTLAEFCAISPRAVQRGLRALEDSGHIAVMPGVTTPKGTTAYRVILGGDETTAPDETTARRGDETAAQTGRLNRK